MFPLALGCMGMSGMYGPADERESIATIHAALDAGITLIDTGDYYGAGHNELLIGRALSDRRGKALLSVKFGALRGPDGGWMGMDARPVALKNFLSYSLTRLGVDHIDIYRPGRLDPAVPIEETVGAIADLIKAGYVRAIGLSEVGADTIRRAQAVHPISDLQIEYSLISRGPETSIFPTVAELGIGVTAYGVLSRGLLSGSRPSSAGDLRAHLPRFTGENLESNQRLVEALQQLAAEKGVSASATCDRLGVVEESEHRAGGRREDACTVGRLAGRAGGVAVAGRRRSTGRSSLSVRGGRHAVRRASDAHPGQRTVREEI